MEKTVNFYKADYEKDELVSKIEDLGDSEEPVVYVSNSDGKNLYIGTEKVTDVYNSKAEDSWTTIEVGGVKKGMTKDQLSKYSTSEIIDMILFKVVQPTKSSSESISLSYSGSTLVSVGTTLPSSSDFTVSVSRGSWSDGTPYAGEYSTSLSMSPDSFGQTSEEKIYTVTLSVTFAAGDTPKDSRGNTAEVTPYSGGTKSKSISISSVYPVYINTDKITEMTSYTLNYLNGASKEIVIPAETEDTKFTMAVPSDVTLTVHQWYEMTNSYDTLINMVQTDTYTENGKEYKKYVRTLDTYSVYTDPVKYKIELKK